MERDVAGASARREHQRRKLNREAKVRQRFGRVTPLVLALTAEPQTTSAWQKGAQGEEIVGAMLDSLAGKHVHVLHDRQMPGSKANIDHLVITGFGVLVVDSKKYTGRIEIGRKTLRIANRDRTSLVESVQRQCDAVSQLLPGVTVSGALCFVAGDLELIRRKQLHNVHITRPRSLRKLITGLPHTDADTPDTPAVAAHLRAHLAAA